MEFLIKQTSLEESLKVFNLIPEWDRKEAGTVNYCKERINGKDSLILSAYFNDQNIGYLIAYQKDDSFYCWVAAVIPSFRRMGILTKMMNIYEKYAKKNNYKKLTLKTLNNKREMLNFLVKNNWNFVNIINNDDSVLNEILVEKEI